MNDSFDLSCLLFDVFRLESIDEHQISRLTNDLKNEINTKQDQIHRSYSTKQNDINRIDQKTKTFIDQYEQLQSKRELLREQIDEYSQLEHQARHVNSNYHQIHHLNLFIDGIKQLMQIYKYIERM
jgi:archaellum component FlaC